MGIKHADAKAPGERGYAEEWNKDHIIDSDVDFNKKELKNAAIENTTSFPAGPVKGQIIFRSDLNVFYIWNGTSWETCNKSARPATLIVAAYNSLNKYIADYVCDGTSDQTEINNAINALPSGGGKVLLLEGCYYLSNTITITKSNVTLQGQGNGTLLYLTDGSNTNIITVGDNSNSYQKIIIKDLAINGNATGQTSNGRAIFFNRNITRSCIENVQVDNSERGILLDYSCTYNSIKNCSIYNTGRDSNSYGIELDDDSRYNRIENNFIMMSHQGICIARSDHNTVIGNISYYNNNNGILIYDAKYNIIKGNVCNDNGIAVGGSAGIFITGSGARIAEDNILIGNICRGTIGTQAYGIIIHHGYADRAVVIGNVCTGNTTGAIYYLPDQNIVEHNQTLP